VIHNKGENYTPWVYDITIEPSHTFISQGVILHNTISIAKAGIVATLKAETAVVAAANPHSGRYDIYATPTQNIRLPPSLLSRFDLIFVVIDRPNQQQDAQVAEFILQNAMSDFDHDTEQEAEEEEIIAPISHDLLKKYIKYAKKNCRPILTPEAKERIKGFYLELRGEYESEDAVISILARNLDALVRLSEAYAKMALRDDVLKSDVEEIIELFKRYLKDTGYDEKTGKIDMDRVLAGESRVTLNKIDAVLARLKEIFEENEWKMLERKGVIQILDVELEDVDKDFIKDALNELVQEGTLYEPKPGHIKFTSREA
jgi:replicative DNA helicase Mcm